jgi:uncharacterized membrane protein
MVTILQSPFVVEMILPFLLVFVVLFAILQKTKVLGDGKRQIDALVSLVVALIVVAFGYATDVIINLMPILAVVAIVILVFMILYGMVFTQNKFEMNKWLRGGIGVIVGIVVIISVLVLTGGWEYLIDFYNAAGEGSALITNIVFIVIIIAVVAFVIWGPKKEDGNSSDEEKE